MTPHIRELLLYIGYISQFYVTPLPSVFHFRAGLSPTEIVQ